MADTVTVAASYTTPGDTISGSVVANPLRQPGPHLRAGLEGMQIDALVLQAAPKPLDEDII
jgi:hypothetical protein